MKTSRTLMNVAIFTYLLAVGTASFAVHLYHDEIEDGWTNVKAYSVAAYEVGGEAAVAKIGDLQESAGDFKDEKIASAQNQLRAMTDSIEEKTESFQASVTQSINNGFGKMISVFDGMSFKADDKPASWAHNNRNKNIINASYDGAMPAPRTLSEIKRRNEERSYAEVSANIEPAVGTPAWTPEQDSMTAEAVLVPRQVTVISSSQDGRIADIFVNHGDTFKRGDLLIAYDCTDVAAEAEIARIQKDLTKKKAEGTDRLFKLDIISDLDRLGAEVEDKQAAAKSRAFEARMEDCQIRARFDGRVTNRLANPGEYTRTDRVLLEVASNEPLRAEFLVPSKWLRWVNVGAPVSIVIGETEKTYTAHITNIHGEVDPVSQSIQMVATLDDYHDPLLPGMSGQATISVGAIRNAGIKGYLEAGYAPQP